LNATAAAPGAPGLDLMLMWHMHQPDYRDHATGEFTMPWVYLHAIKDYSDMAWHLEQNPGLRAVVNFVPVLLDQLEDYCVQCASGHLRDPLLRLLAHGEDAPLTDPERKHALEQCFRANHHRLIAPFAPFLDLYEMYRSVQARASGAHRYLSDAFLYDLVTWYHLAWTGETVRRGSETVTRLMAKGTGFTQEDRLALLGVIADVLQHVIPRYRELARRGQIELTSSPQCHPLAPLMLDFRCAHDAMPNAPLPAHERYPGGRERVCAHLEEALASHERRFGAAPRGIWPAEGALSAQFAALLAERGVRWTASGAGVLANSLHASAREGSAPSPEPGPADAAHRPYRAPGIAPGMLIFFRDDRLSDLIGFVYSKWHGRDAVDNLIHELEAVAAKSGAGPRPLVSLILDGENAWEYYPYNGFFFLSELYRRLCSHASLRTVTGSEVAAAFDARGTRAPGAAPFAPPGELRVLAAGSWVYGNLSTWIGSRDKNQAWDLLCAAKERYDTVMASGSLTPDQKARAQAQLADCEASDWFWWPGDENPGESVSSFESLFRYKLTHLYRLLQSPVPETLGVAFSAGSGPGGSAAEVGGTMRRATQPSP
jgi:alpha-amylase/alpha-mannosidase (GH57 family)